MTAEHWALLRMAAIAVILGATLIKAFCTRARLSWGAVLGLSFPTGMAVIGLVCLVLGMMRMPLVLDKILTALALTQGVMLAVWFLRREKRTPVHHDKKLEGSALDCGFGSLSAGHKWLFVFLSVYLVYQFYFIVANTFLFPIHVYDAITLTALKAKVFLHDGSLDALKYLQLRSYPLMIPFEMFWVAIHLGRWDDTLVNVVFPLTYFGFSLFQYVFMRERYGVLKALAAVALTTSAAFYNYHASIAYQDFALMVFNVAGQMLMLMCFRRGNLDLLPLAGLCAGLGICVKLEGVAYWVINAFLCLYLLKSMPMVAFKEKIRSWIVFVASGIIFYVIHAFFALSQGFTQAEGRYALKEHIELLGRIGQIANNYAHGLFLYNDWTMLWAVLLASMLFFGRETFKDFEARFYVLVITASFAMFLAVDLLTHNYISQHSVLSRVMLHFYPVVPMLIIHLHEGFLRRKMD